MVLAPGKTVIVENPLVTVNPVDNPGAWTQVPPGWYATSFYQCAGGGCAWHMVVRQWSGAGRIGFGSGWRGLAAVWAAVGAVGGLILWA